MALCEGNPPVTGGFPSQAPVTRSVDVFFDLRLNKQMSKQSGRKLRCQHARFDVTAMDPCKASISHQSKWCDTVNGRREPISVKFE